jgi:hypothetical protein
MTYNTLEKLEIHTKLSNEEAMQETRVTELTLCGRGSPNTSLLLSRLYVGAPPPSVSSWPHGENDSSLPSSTVSLNFYEV